MEGHYPSYSSGTLNPYYAAAIPFFERTVLSDLSTQPSFDHCVPFATRRVAPNEQQAQNLAAYQTA
jgi:hypothetical protein